MSAARQLFDRLKQEGIEVINELVIQDEPRPEDLFLEYKQTIGDRPGKVSDDDRKNLAEGISAFGNTEGGVIIWGIKCAQNAAGDDVPTKARPLKQVSQFKSRIERVIAELTLPPHDGIENIVIPAKAKGTGFLVTHVPKANFAPIRSLVTQHYYMRSGSSCRIMPHGVLAAMFGKRPEPVIALQRVVNDPYFNSRGGLVFELGIVITNRGLTIIRDLYVAARVNSTPSPQSLFTLNTLMSPRMGDVVSCNNILSMVSNKSSVWVPGAAERAFQFQLTLVSYPAAGLDVDVSIGCEGAMLSQFRFAQTQEFFRELVDNCNRCSPLLDYNRARDWKEEQAAKYSAGVFRTVPDLDKSYSHGGE